MAVSGFSILTVLQIVIGFVMFIFGIVDRTSVQVHYSFLMLPIWTGIAAMGSGVFGILVGRHHRLRGVLNVNVTAVFRAILVLCIGLSFLVFYLCGLVVAYLGWQDAVNVSIQNLPEDERSKYFKIPDLSTPYVDDNFDSVPGIYAVIMAFCLVEILVGSWMAMMDNSIIIFGHMQERVFYQPPPGQYQTQQLYAQQPTQLVAQQQGAAGQILQQQQLHAVPQEQYVIQAPRGQQPKFISLPPQPSLQQPTQQPHQQPYQQPGQQPHLQPVPQTQYHPQAQGTTNAAGNPENEVENDQAKLL